MFRNRTKTIVSYVGDSIEYNQVNEILTSVWNTLEEKGLGISDIKIIYSILTEMLENAYRYSSLVEDSKDSLQCMVSDLGKNRFQIIVKNPITVSKAEKLKGKIDFVNSLSPIGLKKFYQHEIIKRKDDDHPGAGLGLIIIARKVNEPLMIEVQSLNNNISIVTIKALIKI